MKSKGTFVNQMYYAKNPSKNFDGLALNTTMLSAKTETEN